MLRTFYVTWAIYWGLILLLPLEIIYPETVSAFTLQLAFVILISIGYSLPMLAAREPSIPSIKNSPMPYAKFIVVFGIIISLIGLIFLYYDKTALQGIDYNEGIASAREQWRRAGEERQGISSIYSILGYLLSSSYAVAMVVLISQPAAFKRPMRLLALIFILALVLGNSLLTGGRSALLMLAALSFSAGTSRKGAGIIQIFSTAFERICLLAVVIIGSAYTLYVFYVRASTGGISAEAYLSNFLPFLGFRDVSEQGTESFISDIQSFSLLAFAYLLHSFATVAAMFDPQVSGDVNLFGLLSSLLGKMGIISPQEPTDLLLPGRFPSLPGALWNQTGVLGFIAGSLFLGFLSALCRLWTSHCPRSLIALGGYVGCGSTLILSPFLFAGDFQFFPFVMSSFVLLSLARAMVKLLTKHSNGSYATAILR